MNIRIPAKIKTVCLVLLCIILGVLHLFSPNNESTIALSFIVVSVIVDPLIPFALYLLTKIVVIEYISLHENIVLLFISLISIILFFNKTQGGDNKNKLLYLVWVLLFVLSTFFGIGTQSISAFVYSGIMLHFFTLSMESKIEESKYIVVSLFISGLLLGLYTFYLMATGNASFVGQMRVVYGEGEAGGEVKALAVPVAITIFLLFYALLFKIQRPLLKVILLPFLLILLYVLINTYARGALIGTVCSVLFLVHKSVANSKNFFRIILIILLVIGIYFFVGNLNINEDLMLNNIETGSGRTDIYSAFFKLLFEDPVRIFFGFGPGDIKRVSVGTMAEGYYAHSVFLDYFFTLGIFAFLLILTMLLKTAKVLWLSKNVFYMGLLILVFLVFLTHGSSGNLVFLYSFAICYGKSLTIQREKVQ